LVFDREIARKAAPGRRTPGIRFNPQGLKGK
jgi:hypothetical protein